MDEHIVTCMIAICDPCMSKNPVAWFDLHKEGITRELLSDIVNDGVFQGPPPLFENAPPYDDVMWKFLVETYS